MCATNRNLFALFSLIVWAFDQVYARVCTRIVGFYLDKKKYG